MRKMIETVIAAKLRGVPLLFVTTVDQQSASAAIVRALPDTVPSASGDPDAPPSAVAKISWDSSLGLVGLNDAGVAVVAKLDAAKRSQAGNPAIGLALALTFPEESILIAFNLHRWIDNPAVSQAVLNLREPNKGSGRMLIGVGPTAPLPAELAHDVIVVDDPLPTDDELRAIVDGVATDAAERGVPAPDATTRARLVDAVRGLGTFDSEQVLSLSVESTGFSLASAWERKRKMIDNTPGLTLHFGGPTFDDLGGMDSVRELMSELFAGPNAPGCIVRWEEIEKSVAGQRGDTSGVHQDANQAVLTHIEEHGWRGLIAVGHPGTGKSLFARAVGATFGVPQIDFDLGGTRHKHVGESESRVRAALKTIDAIGGGRVFLIATSNGINDVAPELLRRFTYGTYFWDLPSVEERERIWAIQLAAYGLPLDSPRPDDTDFTGAEIRNLCEAAQSLRKTPKEIAFRIRPIAHSPATAGKIEALRQYASDNFLSASTRGVYSTKSVDVAALTGRPSRRIRTSVTES